MAVVSLKWFLTPKSYGQEWDKLPPFFNAATDEKKHFTDLILLIKFCGTAFISGNNFTKLGQILRTKARVSITARYVTTI